MKFQRAAFCPDIMATSDNQEVIIWTGRGCSACVKAKQFFERKRVVYTERRLKPDRRTQAAFLQATGGAKSVPQIFIGSAHVGGFDDLINLERRGQFDSVLKGENQVPKRTLLQRLLRRTN